MDKKAIRKSMGNQLRAMNRMTYEQHSYLICTSLVNTKEWNNTETIGLTVSRFPEVDTWQLIRKGWDQGKRIVVPKCHPATKEMTFHQISTFAQLESSFFELYEPIEGTTKEVSKSDIDLLIVPGLVYSMKGYRIGFGGGYYDRYLEDFKGSTVSLAFSQQIMDALPIEPHDISVERIITEKKLIDCESS